MNNSEQLFQDVKGSERFAYLEYEEGKNPEEFVTQTYDQITLILEELDCVSPSELYVLRGRVLEGDESKYTTLELGSYKNRDISYVFFNSSTNQGKASILAKITDRKLDKYDNIFSGGDCDSRENSSLKKNEVIVNGVLSTSEYLGICYGGNWYAYADRQKGISLVIPNLHSKEDLILVDTK